VASISPEEHRDQDSRMEVAPRVAPLSYSGRGPAAGTTSILSRNGCFHDGPHTPPRARRDGEGRPR
jgi:hypothetical protein